MDKFHFLAPQWFWLLIPLGLILAWLSRISERNTAWQKVIEPQLLHYLLINKPSQQRWLPLLLVTLTGLLGIFALANPAWEKKPQSVYQTPRAMVIVLDLSASMNAADIKPSRLFRARLKIQDLLNLETEGQKGLVVFAGDAFSVTPLTRDHATIISQLRVLEPDIMPIQGSRVDLGLLKAVELLEQAGISRGDILLIADGYRSEKTLSVARDITKQGHRLSVIGVGTEIGAPISNGQGDVIKDNQGKPILASLNEERLKQIADIGNGRYSLLTTSNDDLNVVLDQLPLSLTDDKTEMSFENNQWQEKGPYLVLLLLPLAALAFRRGWLMVLLLVGFMPLPETAMALTWNDLWETREQQASAALQQQQHEQALNLSDNPAVKGTALYRQQKYAEAYEQFKQLEDADAAYNAGNALARMGKYQEAIEAYDQALNLQAGMQDAIDNKAAVEKLLEQNQQQSQDDSSSQQQQQQSQDPSSDNQQQQQQSSTDEQNSQQDSSDQQSSDRSESSQANEDPNSQNGQDEQENQQQPAAQKSQDQQNQFAKANEELDKQQQNPVEQREEKPQSKTPQDNNELHGEAQTDLSSVPETLDSEEQQAAEQWLRRIPDDPGGLLKRKFLYQYQQRGNKPRSTQAW